MSNNIVIPAETIKEIAQQLDMGMKCFYHKATGELESYPDELRGHAGFDEEMWEEVINKVEENYADYIRFEAMESRDSFGVMEDFISMISNENTRLRFEDAIGYKKPFQNFKQLLQNYPDLQNQWFVYKDQRYIEFVQEQMAGYNATENVEDYND